MRRLLALQDLDLSIDRLNLRRQTLISEEDVRRARENLAETEARLGELRLALDSLARDQRRMEGDIDSLERKAAAEEKRLFDGSVANARELQSIKAEVENLRGRKSRLEDEVLELMERREELDARLAPVEGELAEARDRAAEMEEISQRELQEIEQGLLHRTAERNEVLPEIDPAVLKLYEDLRRQKKGIGVALLENGVCQGCHQKLSALELERLRRVTGIRRCDYCRRILVFD